MPRGILIIRWDKDIGATLIDRYPDTLKTTTKILTNIYTSHRMNNLDPSFSSLSLKEIKVTSFFSGMGENVIVAPNYVIALVLRKDENPFKYKDVLKKGAAKILSNLEDQKYRKFLPELFTEMANV